jgi:phosphate starvation-inducible PhoH-like protein
MIITGDTTQIDLPDPTESGLLDAIRRLRRIKGVATCVLTGEDIVRHDLVQRIVEAYGGDEPEREAADVLREAGVGMDEGGSYDGGG